MTDKFWHWFLYVGVAVALALLVAALTVDIWTHPHKTNALSVRLALMSLLVLGATIAFTAFDAWWSDD